MSDDDSIDFDITISGSRQSVAVVPVTPPPPSIHKKTWIDRVHSRLAFCALCVFVLFIVVGLILLISNIQDRPS